MKSSLFIKTYQADLTWLEWCFKFLDKNWQELSTLYVMAPQSCHTQIKSFKCDLNPVLIEMEEWDGQGYLGQQYFKMMADIYCDGEFITFIDSDAMLTKPTLLSDLCDKDGRPIIWYTPHAILGKSVPWRRIVTEIMLLEPEHEFMRCHPFTYHRDTLRKCRAHLERLHGISLHDLIRRRNERGFTEFNVLGFYAYVFQKNLYSFRNTETNAQEIQEWNRVRQFFSYGDWNEEMPRHLQNMLATDHKPIEVKEPDDAQLFICTWEKDLDWLEVCLKSVKKYWRSRFTPMIVATPECKDRLQQQMMPEALVRYEAKMPDSRRGQVYIKFRMDQLCSLDVDALICTDSDCMFTRESRYQDFCVDGKPIIHHENYGTLLAKSIPQDVNCFVHYREVVLTTMGIEAPAEYMRQHPFVFFKTTITACRALIEKRMGKPLIQVMTEMGHSGYFSEFNCFGAYAETFEGDRYHLADVEPIAERRVHQFHSWSMHPATEPLVQKILNYEQHHELPDQADQARALGDSQRQVDGKVGRRRKKAGS